MRTRIISSLLAAAAAIALATMAVPAHADDAPPATPAVTVTPAPVITPLDTYWGI